MTKYLLHRCMAMTAALVLMLVSASAWSQGPPTAPMAGPAPQNLVAADTPDGVLLSWHVVNKQASYQVLRSLDGAAFDKPLQTLPVGAKGFLDRGFHGKANYQVVGVDGAYRGASAIVQYLPPPPAKDALLPQTLKSPAKVKLAAPATLAPPPPPPAAAPAPKTAAPAAAPAPVAVALPAKAALMQQPLPSTVAASSAAKPPTATPPTETVTGSPFGVEIVKKGPFQVAAGTGYAQVVYCRNGKKVASGGVQTMPSYGKISQSFPPSDSSWYIFLDNEGGPALTVHFYAVCIPSQ